MAMKIALDHCARRPYRHTEVRHTGFGHERSLSGHSDGAGVTVRPSSRSVERYLAVSAAKPKGLDEQEGAYDGEDDGPTEAPAASRHYRCHIPLRECRDLARQVSVDGHGVGAERLVGISGERVEL